MKLGSKSIAIALLFAGLVLANYLASSLPLRLDATADKIYTLSDGTRALLGKIEEPITLDFYFSKEAKGLPVSYKNYAARVQEMLRQYVRASKGRLVLQVIDPRPDTPEEERATAAGLQPQLLQTGEQFSFGLVAIQADKQTILASFNPQRESFLEYDLSQLIYSVQQVNKKKLGLLSSLPLRATMDPAAMQRGRMPQSQYVITEWEKSFDVVTVEPGASDLPANLDVLAVIHPQNLSPKLQYAIDQFILSGKPVFIAVDPSSQHFKRQGNQMSMYGGPQPNVSSDLPILFAAYGIEYKPDAIVGDPLNATKVQTGAGGIASYPVWLSLDRSDLNPKALPTAQLSSLLFIEAGSIALKKDSTLTFTDLIHTTDQAGELPAMALQFAQPDEIARQLKPSGKAKTLAAMISGKFKTAFPNGAPKETETTKKPEAGSQKPEAGGQKPVRQAQGGPEDLQSKNDVTQLGLKESKTTSSIIVVADTDWLLDDFSVRRFNFLGVQAAEPLNDNLNLGANSLEYLGGSQDLVSIRGKGNSLRPFTVVKRMEAEAQKKYQDQLAGVENKLKDVQSKLGELKGKKGETRSLVASPEVRKAVEDYQKQEAEARRERREIRRALREDIDFLENSLLIINLAIPPIFVGVFGLWFLRRRRT
ncbi:MAG: GldG family protein [Opitutaceae bacterium]|jgi:ABC-type uncharacterized transport system involved in gliding motility auxiliary subunit